MAEKTLKITLVKSLIGGKPAQKATAKSLGLNKIGDVTVQPDDASVQGKIHVVEHLVKVERV